MCLNPFTENYKNGFSWTVTSGTENIAMAANGAGAVITPLHSGNSIVRVTHPAASYPQDILVRVIEIVNSVFIETSETIVTVSGEDSKVITASLAGIKNYSDAFVWTVYNADVIDSFSVGNQIVLSGKRNGSSLITVSHPSAQYPRDVMALVRNQAADALNSAM